MNIIKDFHTTWNLLWVYDLNIPVCSYEDPIPIAYEYALKNIEELKKFIRATNDLFGKEKDNEFKNILNYVQDIYLTKEQQAAELLYSIIKKHPFIDGNKRIGCLIFLCYLYINGYDVSKINNAMLATLAICIAESNAHNKESMINFIINLLSQL